MLTKEWEDIPTLDSDRRRRIRVHSVGLLRVNVQADCFNKRLPMIGKRLEAVVLSSGTLLHGSHRQYPSAANREGPETQIAWARLWKRRTHAMIKEQLPPLDQVVGRIVGPD